MLQNVVLLTFFVVLQSRKTTSTFTEKPNAFLMLSGAILQKMTAKVSRNDRFYKVFWSTFLDAPKRCFTNSFLMFRNVVKRNQLLLENLMLSWYFLEPFREKGPKSLNKRQVL